MRPLLTLALLSTTLPAFAAEWASDLSAGARAVVTPAQALAARKAAEQAGAVPADLAGVIGGVRRRGRIVEGEDNRPTLTHDGAFALENLPGKPEVSVWVVGRRAPGGAFEPELVRLFERVDERAEERDGDWSVERLHQASGSYDLAMDGRLLEVHLFDENVRIAQRSFAGAALSAQARGETTAALAAFGAASPRELAERAGKQSDRMLFKRAETEGGAMVDSLAQLLPGGGLKLSTTRTVQNADDDSNDDMDKTQRTLSVELAADGTPRSGSEELLRKTRRAREGAGSPADRAWTRAVTAALAARL